MDAYVTFVCVVVVFVGVLSVPIRGEARSDPIIFDFRFDHKLIPPAPTMMQSTLVVDMMGCLGSCVNSQWCKVGNLKIKPEKNGLYLCEVFSTDAYNKNNKLTVNKVFRHFRIRTPCEIFNKTRCQNQGECVFVNPSYRCKCLPGFQGNGCEQDIDECATNTHNCSDPNGFCKNTEGSFSCDCNQGYKKVESVCTDIDECTTNTHNCSDANNFRCKNTVGSFTCECKNGYKKDGQACTDVDECVTNAHTCGSDPNGFCKNIEGSFSCECNQGYNRDGLVCTDVDECGTGAHNCGSDPNGFCTNTLGSFVCECNQGYKRHGSVCTDIDECATNTHSCGPNANCVNNVGSFICTCKAGLTKIESFCTGGLEKSSIMTNYGSNNYLKDLLGYLEPYQRESQWVVCWDSSIDGTDTEATFHPQCDGKGPTVTIARFGSYIFGGYTDVSWHTRKEFSYSYKTFIYSLRNARGTQPMKFSISPDKYDKAVYGFAHYGPSFGGPDLTIGGRKIDIYHYSTSPEPTYYQPPPGCAYGKKCLFYTGQVPVDADHVEVFFVKI